MSGLSPCVDGSEVARTFFTFAALVGAPVCSAFRCGSHDRWPLATGNRSTVSRKRLNLTPAQTAEITRNMERAGCASKLRGP
jgi:hypothetical protein